MSKTLGADVIIVGGGGAGLAAALDARRAGASALVLEGEGTPGGATAISGGGCSLAGTPLQAASGIEDSPDLAFSDWVRWGQGAADEEWARFYVEHTLHDLYFWLEALGLRWVEVKGQEGNSVPRWHRPEGGGKGIWETLHRATSQAGVNLVAGTQVENLVVENGAVVGVAGHQRGSEEPFEARGRAVVMATGGFMSNRDMIYEYVPQLREYRLMEGSARSAVGTGHRIIERLGGTLTHMDCLWMYAFATPDYRDHTSRRGLAVRGIEDYIWINAQGRRFHNESLPGGASGTPAVLAQKPPFCWAVVDSEMAKGITVADPYYRQGAEYDPGKRSELLSSSPYIKRGETVAELATEMDVPAEAMVATVGRYNEAIDQGQAADPEFGRPLKGRRPVIAAPFYAIQFFPMARKSFGGVKTDRRCRVLDRHFEPIPGLFAAGELAGMAGGHINGRAGLEGTMLGPSLFSGRVAGAWAAHQAGHGPGFVGQPNR